MCCSHLLNFQQFCEPVVKPLVVWNQATVEVSADPKHQGLSFVFQKSELSALHYGALNRWKPRKSCGLRVCHVQHMKDICRSLWIFRSRGTSWSLGLGSGYQNREDKGTKRQASQSQPEPLHLGSPPIPWSLHSTAGAHYCIPHQLAAQKPCSVTLQRVCILAAKEARPSTVPLGPVRGTFENNFSNH